MVHTAERVVEHAHAAAELDHGQGGKGQAREAKEGTGGAGEREESRVESELDARESHEREGGQQQHVNVSITGGLCRGRELGVSGCWPQEEV